MSRHMMFGAFGAPDPPFGMPNQWPHPERGSHGLPAPGRQGGSLSWILAMASVGQHPWPPGGGKRLRNGRWKAKEAERTS